MPVKRVEVVECINLTLKKQEQVHDWYFMLVSHEVCINMQYFFGVVRNKLQAKEDQKFEKIICHVNML